MKRQRNPNLRESYMDGEVLYRKYYGMGDAKSIERLAYWAISNGVARPVQVNEKNPHGLPRMGVWKSMWRWASLRENSRAAYQIYKDSGGDISWEQWVKDMRDVIRTAWQHPTDAKYHKFLRDNGWE